ncbi:hypothetical protein Unana1_06904 [Umbelopsis nana]
MTPQNNISSSPTTAAAIDREPNASQDPLSSPDDENVTEHQYRKLKRSLKECLEINKGISEDLNRSLYKIKTLRFERNILLDKLHSVESSSRHGSHPGAVSDEEDETNYSDIDGTPSTNGSSLTQALTAALVSQSATKTAGLKRSKLHSSAGTTVISAPPKRNRNPNVKVTTRRVQPVPRDADGKPIMPLQIGVITVQDLGHVVWDRSGFHTERYIWPVGYTITRSYPSMIDPKSNTTVRATILDDGNNQPLFRIECADCPTEPIVANSATGAWTAMVKRANEVRGILRTNSASGPDYYGLGHATVASLVQELEGADKCKDYVWQQFEAMQDRAAKGVMKACAKKRGNLEKLGSVKYRMAQKTGFLQASSNLAARPSTSDHEDTQDELELDLDDDAEMEQDSSLMMDEDEVDELEDVYDDPPSSNPFLSSQ